jgi:hypothetical protein
MTAGCMPLLLDQRQRTNMPTCRGPLKDAGPRLEGGEGRIVPPLPPLALPLPLLPLLLAVSRGSLSRRRRRASKAESLDTRFNTDRAGASHPWPLPRYSLHRRAQDKKDQG